MKNKLTDEDFTVYCISCGSNRDLQMWPHRNEKQHMVGWVFACMKCEKKLPDATLSITYQDDQNHKASLSEGKEAKK